MSTLCRRNVSRAFAKIGRKPPSALSGRFALLLVSLIFAGCDEAPTVVPDESFVSGAVNYPARQRTQLFSGWYDEATQRTFVVYAGGLEGGASACAPQIVSFDHDTEAWSEPREVAPSPVDPDSHHYPQVLMDSRGRVHVFQSFHNNHPIQHAVSEDGGQTFTVSDLEGTSGATYGAAFRSIAGDFYVFFRHRDDNGEADYEPEYFIRSSDEGQTWTRHRAIDPVPDHPAGNDGWGTVYVKSTAYQATPVEGLHVVFGIHYDHNQRLDAHYYAFFRFSDDAFVSVAGDDLGPEIDRSELPMVALFDHGGPVDFYNVNTAVGADDAGAPAVFFNFRRSDGETLRGLTWTGDRWQERDPGFEQVSPFEVEVGAVAGDAVIYAIERRRTVHRYRFAAFELVEDETLYQIPDNDYRLAHLTFIRHGRPELRGFFFHGRQSPWQDPTPTGSLIAFGDGPGR